MSDTKRSEHRFDLIIDTGGRNKLTGGIGRQLRAALLSPFISQRLAFFISKESVEYIAPLADYLAAGTITAVIGQRFDLDGVAAAIGAMEAGTLTTKTVISVKP